MVHFIKITFNISSNNYKTHGYRSVINGIYKLEVQIVNYNVYKDYYKKSEYVQIAGYVKIVS